MVNDYHKFRILRDLEPASPWLSFVGCRRCCWRTSTTTMWTLMKQRSFDTISIWELMELSVTEFWVISAEYKITVKLKETWKIIVY